MTLTCDIARARSPSGRVPTCGAAAVRGAERGARDDLGLAVVCLAAMALGAMLDRRFALPAALIAPCAVAPSLWGAVASLWLCMPATSLATLSAGPVWIGLSGVLAGRDAPRREGAIVPLRSLACHALMVVGMIGALWLGPCSAAFLRLPWNEATMMMAMAGGMTAGLAGGPICGTIGRLARAGRPARRGRRRS